VQVFGIGSESRNIAGSFAPLSSLAMAWHITIKVRKPNWPDLTTKRDKIQQKTSNETTASREKRDERLK